MTIDPHLEFHRHAAAQLPSLYDRHPGVAFFVPGKPSQEFCTCQPSTNQTCPHLKALFKSMAAHIPADPNSSLEAEFSASTWYHLATVLGQADRPTPEPRTVRRVRNGDRTTLRTITPQCISIIAYGSTGDDRNRLAERLGALAARGSLTVPDRSDILRRLQLWFFPFIWGRPRRSAGVTPSKRCRTWKRIEIGNTYAA